MRAVVPTPATSATSVGGTGPAARGPWRLRADPALAQEERTIRELLAPHLGDRLLPGDGDGTGPVLRLTLGDPPPAGRTTLGIAPDGAPAPVDEAYGVVVDADGITCRARTRVGAFRAATTALQLIALADGGTPEAQEIADAPRYAWRGLLLDPARSFVPPARLRRLIDLAALYKLNVLHLHLTDNEGWRIETPSVPALTAPGEPGARSFYSAEEYTALQEYAARRHITLVPEIDLPGHCAALRAAVPGLPAAPAPPGVEGRFPYVPPLDLADTRTRETVRAVLADVCALTTGPFVHIGGDEAVGITDESFADAVDALRAMVRASGKRPVAWQESARAGVTASDIAQFWVDPPMMDLPGSEEELALRPDLLDAGFDGALLDALRRFFAPSAHDVERVLEGGGRLILSPQSHLYLDRRYAPETVPAARIADAARLGFPAYRPRDVRYTAAWDPAAHGIPDEQVAGVEATLFGETLRSFDDLTTLLLPRLASLAGTAWSGRPDDWETHRHDLARHAALWRARDLVHFPATDVPWS